MVPWSCVFFAALLAGFAVSPGWAAPKEHRGGRTRSYFRGLKPEPLRFADTGRRKANVIWIVIDALRPDHLGLYGYPKPTTPFLDALAAEGFTFTNAYCDAPWTRSSTASMFTGLYPSGHRTQTDRSRLPPNFPTVAEELKKLGYRTAAVVGNGNAGSIAGLDRGFDDYVDTVSHWDGLPAADDVYTEAISWLRTKRPAKQPWMLFLFLVDPHDPYHAPPEYEREWLGAYAGEPPRRVHWEYNNKLPPAKRAAMISLYDAAIRYTDDATRRFFDEVRALGLYDGATIVVTADHGEAFGEHGYYKHAYHQTDEFLRVPLIVRTPAWRGGGHVPHLVQLTDIAPTLLGLGGGAPPKSWVGSDLTTLIARPSDLERVAISEYNEFGVRRSAAFTPRYKVILQLPADRAAFFERIPNADYLPSVSFDREVVQIYDRRSDPFEQRNLAGTPPPRARELLDGLRDYMQAAPSSNQEVDLETMPRSLVDDLRSLGYVQ